MAFNPTEDITKLCRICLGEGELNLMEEHIVHLPFEDEEQNGLEEKLSAHEMLSVFSKHDYPEVDSDAPVAQLICHLCLDELIPSFLFCRKVRKADRRLAEFWENIATDVISGEDEEAFLYLDEEDGAIKEEYEVVSENEEDVLLIESSSSRSTVSGKTSNKAFQEEVIQVQDAQQQTVTTSHGQKRRKMGKNPKFVLTDGVSQILANANRSTACEESVLSSPSGTPSPQKRLKKRDREKLNLQHGSFVVTQFIPSSSHIESLVDPEEQQTEADNPMAGNELRTMDYAAVEIEVHGNELHVNENDTITPSSISGEPGENPQAVYVCKYCPQAFSAAHFLMTHVRKHHVCKYCTQSFNQSTDLFEHIRSTHTVHKCAICSKELSTHSNLRSHIKRVHGVKLPAQVALLDYRPRGSVDIQHPPQPEEETPQVVEEENYEWFEVQEEEEYITTD